ncbi:ABC transporter ATP-binding protein [bacterium]|nr:MAG: ABC transporter ATP-binding protein [bacterium]
MTASRLDGEDPRLPFRDAVAILRRFWRFARPYRGKFFLSLALLLFAVPLGQFALFLTRDVTNQALLATNLTVDQRWSIVVRIVGLQILFWLASAVLSTWREVLEWYGSMRSTFDVRIAFYRHLQRLPLGFLSLRAPGEHLFRATTDMVSMFRPAVGGQEVAIATYSNDVDPYDPGIMGMIFRSAPLLVETVYSLAWGAALLFLIDPALSLALALYVVPFTLASQFMFGRVRRTAFAFKRRTEYETGVLRDSIAGLRTLKAFGRVRRQLGQYFGAAANTRRKGIRLVAELVLTQNVVQSGLRWAFSATVYIYVAFRILQGKATVGDWVATFLLIEAAQIPLEKFVGIFQLVRMQLVPAQRVLETLDVEPKLQDLPGALKLSPISGGIRFEGVEFAYERGRPALQGIDLTVEPGEYIGIVGPSGAGKSSLIALALRLYGADAGSIRYDGYDIREVQIQSLLEQTGTVPQLTTIYSGTIADNVLFGNPWATPEQLSRALELSGVGEFACRLPKGIETEIGEGGSLSGGERQRIGIARALVRSPRILFLDEATASLDPATEDAVLRAVDGLRSGLTILSIAHRLKAVVGCDRIVVMDAGRIVQIGNHAELVAKSGLYRDLWHEQARGMGVA